MTERSQQPGGEIRAGDKVAHRHMPRRVGRVDEVVKRGDRFFPLDVDPGIDRVAWVKWEGEGKLVVEPVANLIKWIKWS
jgi:hypothetical protein